ncbi:SRRT protein, partial [Amia calva]|nr:SRRT protein [Amia calva]
MADSDDEYDRRRRDKFRRERSDYDRSREREERLYRRSDILMPSFSFLLGFSLRLREWDRGRERRSRGEYRDYDRGRRERFSPPRHDLSPQQKRMRRDWDDHGGDPYHGGGYDLPYGGGGGPSYVPPQPWGHPDLHLMQPHHGIPIQARTEAVRRYNDYKLDFRRQQMQDFFLAHKDEEWYGSPERPSNRLGVFVFLLENSWFDSISLDIDRAASIIKILDAAVIKMEGGTDTDLRILEQPSEEEEEPRGGGSLLGEPPKREELRAGDADRKPPLDKEDKEKKSDSGAGGAEEKPKAGQEEDGEKAQLKDEPEAKKLGKKRKRQRSGDSEEDEPSDSESESGSEKPPPEEDREEEEDEDEEKDEAEVKEKKEEKLKEREKEREREREEKKAKEKEVEPPPRPLHKTCSLFMRSIAPTISKAEIVALCRRYPGFMRVALSDPQPERRFYRRCWVTFDRSVNIKETCWNLQNIRLRDCELSPGVNRDLARRVRNVNGITQHKQVLRNDIKLAAKLIHALDERERLWAGAPHTQPEARLPAQNPILKNITDYLIEEVSAEEEELLGSAGGTEPEEGSKEGNPAEITVERDDKLVKVLDRLLLYLRIVHSIDYYNTCDYPNEDEMPNRCGIMHVRGPIPPNRITHGEVAEWQKTFEEKLTPLLSVRESLSEEEASKMGRKDPEQEVEKFVSANTQELGKDKWLCPLSGKKFKVGGPPVRSEGLGSGVRLPAALSSLSLSPPAGPRVRAQTHLQQARGQDRGGVLSPGLPYPHQSPQGLMGYGQPRPPVLGYGGGPPYPPNQYGGGGRGNYDSFRGQGGYPGKPRNRMIRGDPRAIIEYRDLDAPEDVDFF